MPHTCAATSHCYNVPTEVEIVEPNTQNKWVDVRERDVDLLPACVLFLFENSNLFISDIFLESILELNLFQRKVVVSHFVFLPRKMTLTLPYRLTMAIPFELALESRMKWTSCSVSHHRFIFITAEYFVRYFCCGAAVLHTHTPTRSVCVFGANLLKDATKWHGMILLRISFKVKFFSLCSAEE